MSLLVLGREYEKRFNAFEMKRIEFVDCLRDIGGVQSSKFKVRSSKFDINIQAMPFVSKLGRPQSQAR